MGKSSKQMVDSQDSFLLGAKNLYWPEGLTMGDTRPGYD